MSPSQNKVAKQSTRFVAGTIWMVAMRWAMRFIGFFSSIILARLLAPEDFGLVAMAMIVVALIDALSDTGVDLAIIRGRESSGELYNAAWTIQVLQGVIISFLILCSISFAVSYFGEENLSFMLSLLAASHFIYGFKNIGTVEFRKELNFAKEFRFLVCVRILSFLVTVSLAFLLRDYRAIVFGLLSKSIFEVLLSYGMHPYRPKFSYHGIKKIWGFSQWLLISSVGGVVSGKTSQLIVGGSLGSASLGFYYLAAEVGSMFVQEIVMPIRRALFPNLSLLQDDERQFVASGLQVLGVVSLLCLPVGVGLSIVAEDVVAILFGQNWLNTVPILRWTALIAAVAGISMSLGLILMVKNRVDLTALKVISEVAVLIPVLIWVGESKNPVDIAMAKLLVSVVFLPLMYWFVSRVLEVPVGQLLSTLWRPLAAVSFMYACDYFVLADLHMNLFFSLVVHALVGAASYLFSLYFLWVMSGCPNSAEKIIFSMVSRITQR